MNYKRNGFNFFIIIFILEINKFNSKLSFKYPTSNTLANGNIFVIEENGIFVCDPDLTTIIKEVKIFSENEKISTLDKLSTVILIRRNDFIISLINYKVYFFKPDGTFLYNSEKLIQNYNPTSVSLTPITISANNVIDYVVSYFDAQIHLNLLYYMYDIKNNINKYYSTTKMNQCKYINGKYYDFKNQGLSCLYFADYYFNYYYSSHDHWYIVCFFVTIENEFEYLEEMAFYINDNNQFSLSGRYTNDYIKFNINYFNHK